MAQHETHTERAEPSPFMRFAAWFSCSCGERSVSYGETPKLARAKAAARAKDHRLDRAASIPAVVGRALNR